MSEKNQPHFEEEPISHDKLYHQREINDLKHDNTSPIPQAGYLDDSREELDAIRLELDQEIVEKTQRPPESGVETFDVWGTNVTVTWHRYEKKELTIEEEDNEVMDVQEDVGVIFLPGWSSTPESKSTLHLVQSFAQQVAKDGGSFVLSVDTRAEQIIEDSLFYEAEAIRRFITKGKLSEIVLAGHSQGGDEAINLAALLEEKNPEIKLRGLILLDAVGIYKQGKFELLQKFLRDELKSLLLTGFSKRIRQAEKDIVSGIGKEISKSKASYLKRLKNEISNMAEKNPRADKIKCPVVLVQGKGDLISSPKKTKELAKKKLIDKDIEEESRDPRENLLKGIFPNSTYIRWLQAKNEGNHFVPLQRGETVAAASLYLLRRHQRAGNENSKEPKKNG